MKHTSYLYAVFALFSLSFILSEEAKFEIIYEYKNSSNTKIKIDDSIEMVLIDGNRDTSRSKIKMKLNKDLFDFSFKIICVGNEESSLIKMESSSANNGIEINAKTPDSLVFKNKKWFSYSGSKVKEVPIVNSTIKKSGIFKTILGYNCQKYIVWDEGNENLYEVWVCEELPHTLMPGAGYKPFNGAILEVYFPDNGGHFFAKKISKL